METQSAGATAVGTAARVKPGIGGKGPSNIAAFIENNADGILIVESNGNVLFANPAAQSFLRATEDELLERPFRFPLPAGDTTELTLACRNGRNATADVRVSAMQWYGETVYIVLLRNRSSEDTALPPFRTTAADDDPRDLGRFLDGNPDPMLRVRGTEVVYANASARRVLSQCRGNAGPALPELLARAAEKGRRSVELAVNERVYSFHVVSGPGDREVDAYGSEVTEIKRLEQRFYQSQKMEAVGRLAGGIAHDFNNMMTVVTGYGESLLLSLEDQNPLRQSVNEILSAGRKAAALTQQLLAFSRKQLLHPRILDLNEVVAGIENMIRRLIGEDVAFDFLPQEGVGRVKADAGQIDQVILNLVVNAKDAMPEGGRLAIETADVELDEGYAREHIAVEPGRYVMLAVSDTGTGIEEKIRSKIFEPFFTTKDRGKGTGLGLSTVYGIVKQSGGNIWVYSEPRTGTCFKLYFPRVEATDEREPRQSLPASAAITGTETVLLVEDEPMVRRLVRRVLTGHGYRIIEAGGAKEALKAARETLPIHLMITDVVLPELNGRSLARRVARRHPETRVLFMSGYADRSIVRHGVLSEGAAFLQKPFTALSLLRRVREILDRGADDEPGAGPGAEHADPPVSNQGSAKDHAAGS